MNNEIENVVYPDQDNTSRWEDEVSDFENGEIIVNDDFTVIGAFYMELHDTEGQITFPTFHVACANGQVHTNYDDLMCDWPGDYRRATDEEIEIFLQEIEDFEGMVWNPEEKILEVRDDSSWRIQNHFYPKTWEEAEKNYTSCSELSNELFCCGWDEDYSGRALSMAQLKLLYDIYSHGNKNVSGEVSYAVVPSEHGEIELRPYIYGKRNSLLTFRYKEQAITFMTYFEDMIKKCSEFLQS